jgi:hypothetical protein
LRGYWVKADEVYDVSDETDYDFIINNPDKFDLTVQDIQLLFDYCGEETDHQKVAKEHLLRIAESQGWIRIRYQTLPSVKWHVNCDNPSARENEIKQFFRWAIDKRIMSGDSVAVISGSDVQEDFQEYQWKDCLISKYLMT